MSIEDLAALAQALAADPAAWQDQVAHDPERRTYHRLLDTAEVTAWLICWMPGHDTGFHDHDGAAGAVYVVAGELCEERLRLGGPPASTRHRAGETFTFGGADIHRVVHAGLEPAVTIHVYSPQLRRMGAYVAGPDGALLRHALDEDTELTPAIR